MKERDLFRYISDHNVKKVKKYIKKNMNINIYKSLHERLTPLMSAVSHDNLEIATLLLQAGADLDMYDDGDCTAFCRAVESGNEDMVELFIEHRAQVNRESKYSKWTPLNIAANCNETEVLMLLLSSGADPNLEQSYNYYTPLMFSASQNDIDNVKVLISRGANINFVNRKKNSPLSLSVYQHAVQSIEYLIQQNVDINCLFYDEHILSKSMRIPMLAAYIHEQKDTLSDHALSLWKKYRLRSLLV